MGSVIGLKDGSGNTLLEYAYDGFGKAYVVSNGNKIAIENYTGSDYNNDRLFTSREFDKGTKLYYYRARYYSAEQGRFISRDPLGIADDINLYSYVGNNPLNYSDPLGLFERGEFAVGVGVGSWDTAKGMAQGTVDFVTHPIDTTVNTIQISAQGYAQLGSFTRDAIQNPDSLGQAWDGLSDREKGEILGQIGTTIAAMKLADKAERKAGTMFGREIKCNGGTKDLVRETTTTTKIHGNSYKSTEPTELYNLVDKEGNLWKIGETQRGSKRYTNKFYKENGVKFQKTGKVGLKRDIRKLEKSKLEEFFNENGELPPGNKTFR